MSIFKIANRFAKILTANIRDEVNGIDLVLTRTYDDSYELRVGPMETMSLGTSEKQAKKIFEFAKDVAEETGSIRAIINRTEEFLQSFGKKKLTCKNCGLKDDTVIECFDPWCEEIENRQVKTSLCPDCYQSAVDET